METFAGHRAASGELVAVAAPSLIAAVVESGEVVEIILETGSVTRVRIGRSGHSFTRRGDQYAYGYLLEDAAATDGAA